MIGSFDLFLSDLLSDTLCAGDRYEKLLQPTANLFRGGPPKIPLLHVMVAGQSAPGNAEAVELVNRIMVDFVRVYKKVCVKEGECPYYSPSSTMTAL